MNSNPALTKPKIALLCAGGTGGHLFPAHALAGELKRRGYEIHLVSDQRIERFATDFPADVRHSVPSATLSTKSPLKLMKALYSLFQGYLEGRRLVRDVRPDVVVGFGGYPTVPPLLAASTKGVPCLIHEANAVLGRANSFLARYVDVIALGLPLSAGSSFKTVLTGNPVRDEVLEAAKTDYSQPESDQPFVLTVFGGSQGAQFFSSTVPKAVGYLSEEDRNRLYIYQQAREEDQQAVRSAYEVMGVKAEVAPFFSEMPRLIAESHLILCRSGASTTAELAVIGRPAILVPYPHALDHDQAANAAALTANKGGWVKAQSEITPVWLAEELARLIKSPELLSHVAANAKAQGKADATANLANIVELLAERKPVDQAALGAKQSSHA